MLLSFHKFVYSWQLLLLLISRFIPLCSDRMQDMISIFPYLFRLALYPNMWLILEKVPGAPAENILYFQSLVGNFCRNQLDLFDLWCNLTPEFLFRFFPDDLFIGKNKVLRSLTINMLCLTCSFRYNSFFIKLRALVF